MISRRTPDLENKLLILFAVDQLGPMTSLQLLQFLAQYDLMDYITMQLTLFDLLATSHLQSIPHALGPLYTLTQEGKESLSLFLRRLPHSLKTLVQSTAAEWKPRFQREMQILSDFHRRDDGVYALRLRLLEKDLPLLDMTLLLPSRDLSDRLSRRWPAAAPAFYGFLMKELGDDFSSDMKSPNVLPQGTTIDLECTQGCILRLNRDASATTALTMALTLPTESMALFFAGRWAEKADDICTFLMDRLSEE